MRVTFADASEPLGEGSSSTQDIQVHRQQCGAVVKMHLLPLAVVVGGFIYKAGEVITPLYAWEQGRQSRADQVDK